MAAVSTFNTINHKHIFHTIDGFLNSKSFRCMKTKFSVYYYNQIVLICTNFDKAYLDFIYTDGDLMLATWSSTLFLPKNVNEIFHKCREHTTNHGVILLCGLSNKGRLTCSVEMHLVLDVLENQVTLQFLLLAKTKESRLQELFQLITEYERLTSLLGDTADQSTRGNVIEAVQLVTGTAAENTATIGIETTATSLGHAAAGVVLAVVVDLAVTASMLARAKVRKNRGKITELQYKREVRERLFQTGCQFVAGTTGTIVGQIVVPVPVVGAAVGGFMGSLIGLGVSLGISKIHKAIEKVRRRRELAILETKQIE